MNAKGLTPWLGWLVAGALGAYIAVDKARVSPPNAPFAVAPLTLATPQGTVAPGIDPLPQPSVDPSIQAALAALSISARETPAEIAPAPGLEADRPSPIVPHAAPTATPSATPEVRSSMDFQGDLVASMTPTLERMAADARRLTEGQIEYAKSCVGTTAVPYRDVYGSQVQGTLSNKDLPECVALKAEMAKLKLGLERKGAEVQDSARKAGVLPGVIRRLAEKYDLRPYLKP